MELILPFDILRLIFSFLDKKSIMIYDTAVVSREKRSIFLDALKQFNISIICRWTYIRNIRIEKGLCAYYNTSYIPKMCKNLIINSGRIRGMCTHFDVINHSIIYLHIDLFNSKGFLRNIDAKNLEKITFVHYKNYDEEIVQRSCPKLKKVTLIID